jgi:hypothetical protein
MDRAVLSTVAYGDVFEFPMRDDEVHRYLHGVHASPAATAAALARCSSADGALSRRDGYYTLRGREGLVAARRERLVRASALWSDALRYGRVIAGLPFVRLVAVTGSLAWENVPPASDIDYLIVTDPDHLWVCRWLVALVRRTARLRGVRLCPNYMVTTRALTVARRDLFDAYELCSMRPIAGVETYRALRRANLWTADHLPNAADEPDSSHRLASWRGTLSRVGEAVLRSRLGVALERYEMRYRLRKIRSHRMRHFRETGQVLGEGVHNVDRCIWFGGGHRRRAVAAFAERLPRFEGAGR